MLKLLLFALFFLGCDQNERELEKLSYLTADIEGEQKVSRFSGTLTSKKSSSGTGEVSLAVKMRSEEGETIEFLIADYEENRIYRLDETPLLQGMELSHTNSSGSSRSFIGRFFFDSGLQVSF